MVPANIKDEVDKNIERLQTLRDEVKLKLHLASLEAKTEWDEKLSPKLFEVEEAAKQATDSTRLTTKELVAKVEQFLARLV
jgi:hypothetical protein